MKCGAALALVCAAGAGARGQTFQGIGYPAGASYSQSVGISADGLTVIGVSDGGSFRWTAAGGRQSIPVRPYAISADGSVIVGDWGSFAARWTSAGGPESLGGFPGGLSSSARGVSPDGSIVVGGADDPLPQYDHETRAFYWTRSGGMIRIDSTQSLYSYGVCLTSGGVAYGVLGANGDEAFSWTSAGGLMLLGGMSGDSDDDVAAVTPDGQFVVGAAANTQRYAFRWTEQGGRVSLGMLPGDLASGATCASADGAIVGGYSEHYESFWVDRAALWTRSGVLNLGTYLPSLGIDLTGWSLTDISGVSGDGRVITGSGLHGGVQEAWVATIPSNPCYANCDGSSAPPILNVSDFTCFFQKFATGSAYANCDGSTGPPVLNVQDFTCFLQKFAQGCP
jgi:hypothetical protein